MKRSIVSVMKLYVFLLILILCACEQAPAKKETAVPTPAPTLDTSAIVKAEPKVERVIDYDTTQWFEVVPAEGVELDLRYATTDNFTKEVIYPCGRCFINKKSAPRFLLALDSFRSQGYGVKLFDCYRPHPAQERLWAIVPNPQYVADPKKGSMHNRGLAIDLTLTTLSDGAEVDMGAPFDFFGRRAYHDFMDLPEEVLQHRTILKGTLAAFGFKHTRTEWWHYSDRHNWADIATFEWPCQ